MALTTSAAQSCYMCFSERCWGNAISLLVAERGDMNSLGRKMRYSNFLFGKASILFSRSSHKAAKKVSITAYDGLHNLFDNKEALEESGPTLNCGIDEFDVSLTRKQFPSIMFGRSEQVQLFDGTAESPDKHVLLAEELYKELLPSAIGSTWVGPDSVSEPWQSVAQNMKYSGYKLHVPDESQLMEAEVNSDQDSASGTCSSNSILQDEISSPSKEELSYTLPLCPDSETQEIETKPDIRIPVDNPSMKTSVSDRQETASVEMILDKAISWIPGLRKKQQNQLEDCGFHTIRKTLHHFPRTYADVQNAQIGIEDGQYLICVGKIISSRGFKPSPTFSLFEVIVNFAVEGDSASEGRQKRTLYLHLKKFFRGTRFSYGFLKVLEAKHQIGDIVCVSGKVKAMSTKDHYEIKDYHLDLIHDENDASASAKAGPFPIYPSKGGLNPNFIREVISRTLGALPVNIDPIPKEITQEFGLISLYHAYIGIHQPKDFNEADSARRRLIFDEFFYLQLARLFQMLEGLGTPLEKDGLLEKYRKPVLNSVLVENWCSLTRMFLKALPYVLTSSQLNAVSEIIWDLKRQVPMNRLLQGDVGCGKTVVAFLACLEVIGSGYQAAFMVPTELLAVQHYEQLLKLLENMEDASCKPSVALLTGSTPAKNARLIREGLQSGDIDFAIGTHSLIAEKVEFSALRIAVIDEQHRFGVIQRGRFNSKLYNSSVTSRIESTIADVSSKEDMQMAPHVLSITATPIPRTLALALYGDMSLTQITDLPPGRLPTETLAIVGDGTGLEKVYQMMEDELETGGRVYLVFPLIGQSEQLPQLHAASDNFEGISKRFERYNCGLLHGRMKGEVKEEALRCFRSGETQILLATQVIEIGVDVPEASMMVVMNAERFGIAQLHQLRGRVGRGVRKSKCLLVTATASGRNRVNVLEKSSDGFWLANMDLIFRGPGDLLGKRQSGHLPEFPIARLERDGNIMQEAHIAALKILGESHNLEKFPELKAELSMRQPLCLLGD